MKVTIENFQSIGKAHLTFTGLSVIVGPSNYGKSAVLRAIEGVLFNRPGEHIVRKGAKNAAVTIEDLPGMPGPVTWTKGVGNKYAINGVDFSRVGSTAPQPLQDAGYRDVWIGDAANKKGESLRPQVGEQFDPLFLLTRHTGFVADVLGLMSRHAVVSTAQDRCASDLRSTKQRLGQRRTDLEALDVKLAVLAVVPVIDAGRRVVLTEVISGMVRKLVQLRTLRETRAKLVSVPRPQPMFDGRASEIKEALQMGEGATAIRTALSRKWFLQAIPASPAVGFRAVDEVLIPAKVIAGVRRRRQLVGITAPSFKPLPSVVTGKVQTLRGLVEQRREAMDTLFVTQQAMRACEDDLTAAKAALAEIKVCPTCGQSMSTVGV